MLNISKFVKNLTALAVIFGPRAKKLGGINDALNVVTDVIAFTAPDTLTFSGVIPDFLNTPKQYFRVTSGGGANSGLLLRVLSVSGSILTVDTATNAVSTEAAGATTLDARLAIVINDTSIADLNELGSTYFNINNHTPTGVPDDGSCLVKKMVDHYHPIPPGLCPPFEFSFVSGDWFSTDAGDTYSIDVAHNTSTLFPTVTVFEGSDEVYPHTIRVLDANTVRLQVTQEGADCRFEGSGIIRC